MKNRKCGIESLEARLALTGSDILSDYVDISQLVIEPTYTTVDSPANHVTGTGTAFDGVVKLTMQTNTGTFIGSGTLLPTGRHILTAAHNVTGVAPDPVPVVTSVTATFELSSGNVNRSVMLNSITVQPTWNRVLSEGSDIAILELTTAAPASAPRFDIYRGSSERLALVDKAGYGLSGQGIATIAAGTKRDGQNRWELFFDESRDILLYDFDSGNAANNTFELIGATSNLGSGNEEVMTAPGDSGGPSLINGLIAGVTSFSTRADGGTGDSDSLSNSSFGEIGGDTRVSVFQTWIDSVVDIVAPTAPGSLDLTSASDSGVSASDNVTNDITPTFTWAAASDVRSGISGYWWAVDDITPQTGGTFTTTLTATPTVANGAHVLYVAAVDGAGNIGAPASLSITVDTVAPSTPALPDLLAADDSGSSSTDNRTKLTTPRFSGTTEANATVTLLDGGATVGTGAANGSGAWQITSTGIGQNANRSVTVRATDLAGNSSTSAPLTVVIDTIAPRVANLTVSGSTSTHAPYAFNNPADDVNDADGSGVQLKTVPVGGADTVAIALNETIGSVGSGNLTLRGLVTGVTPAVAGGGFTFVAGSASASWRFGAQLGADQFLVTLADAVADVAGNLLDGEWTNPFSVTTTNAAVSEFPSGNGTAGGAFKFVFTNLPGDADRSNEIDGADVFIWQNYNNPGVSGRTFILGDFDGDGVTDGDDHTLLQAYQSQNLHLRDLAFADMNGDFTVNTADLIIINNHFGQNGVPHNQGDVNNDGTVDGEDLTIWQQQQGLLFSWVA